MTRGAGHNLVNLHSVHVCGQIWTSQDLRIFLDYRNETETSSLLQRAQGNVSVTFACVPVFVASTILLLTWKSRTSAFCPSRSARCSSKIYTAASKILIYHSPELTDKQKFSDFTQPPIFRPRKDLQELRKRCGKLRGKIERQSWCWHRKDLKTQFELIRWTLYFKCATHSPQFLVDEKIKNFMSILNSADPVRFVLAIVHLVAVSLSLAHVARLISLF